MKQTVIVLESNYIFLGEIRLENGAFTGAQLSDRGEAVIGRVIQRWQMHGIPSKHPKIAGKSERSLADYRILKHDNSFGDALMHWAKEHGFHAIALGETELVCWNKCLMLPLEEHERYAIMCAVEQGNATQVKRISKFLDDAVALAEREAEILEKQIKRLRIERARTLVKKHA